MLVVGLAWESTCQTGHICRITLLRNVSSAGRAGDNTCAWSGGAVATMGLSWKGIASWSREGFAVGSNTGSLASRKALSEAAESSMWRVALCGTKGYQSHRKLRDVARKISCLHHV